MCAFTACGPSVARQPTPPASAAASRAPTSPAPASEPAPPPTLVGSATYDDGAPASGALITLTNHQTGVQDAVLAADSAGHFGAVLAAGDYTLAAATDRGFAFTESLAVPNAVVQLTLSRSCHPVTGQLAPVVSGTRVELLRYSKHHGDNFFAQPRETGTFQLCLPEGQYGAHLVGAMQSPDTRIGLPTTTSIRLTGTLTAEITRPPQIQRVVAADQASLVADIIQSNPQLIGLGEATHGTAEFVPTRGALTLELARRADLRAMLVEVDAIAAMRIDDYVNGAEVDPAKAVADLGFWITDTYEFLHFLAELRQHNATATNPVHFWGIDVQNTELPVKHLLASAARLGITAKDRALLEPLTVNRGKAVKDLPPAQRTTIDRLLERLAKPRGPSPADLRTALAARSLAIQLGYWEGDMSGNYGPRRDAGMASLALFILAQTGGGCACLWAHNGHVGRWPHKTAPNLGMVLAGAPLRYYTVGFFQFQGTTRAWDAAGAIGVISHPIPPGSPYSLEGAVMAATGSPEIAWAPVPQLTPALGSWLDGLRFTRELGHTYYGEADSLSLLNPRTAFDALVVIKTGHDSTPTPTGVRRAAQK